LGSYAPVEGAEIKVYRSGLYDTTLVTDASGYGGLVYIPNSDNYDFYICYSSGRSFGSVRNYQLISCYLPVYWCINPGRCQVYVGSNEPDEAESIVTLHQNYPNPFNPVTKIKFDLPNSNLAVGDAKILNVTLKIYDILGKEAAVLVDKEMLPGTYEAEFDAASLPSGIYYYKLDVRQAGSSSVDFTQIKKMVLIK